MNSYNLLCITFAVCFAFVFACFFRFFGLWRFINIYSSASYVPTKTYGTNERLTKIRAENMKYDLITHFEKNDAYKGRVNVVIVTTIVQGPEYEKDSRNKEKYFPYQYVGLKTE